MKKSVDWVQLVRDAKKSNEGLERLYDKLAPAFGYLKLLCNPTYLEEAKQEARIRVWKHLEKVDFLRSTKIKAYLCSLIMWASQDALKIYQKQHFYTGIGHDEYANIPQKVCPDCPFDFDGLLLEYLKYIRENGRIQGASTYFARKTGYSVEAFSQYFRDASDVWIKRNRKLGNLN